MHVPWVLNSRLDAASPTSRSPPPPLPTFPAVVTAQQAEESIGFVQRELLRLLRACEYREQNPLHTPSKREGSVCAFATSHSISGNNSASTQTTSTLTSQRHDTTVSPLSDTEPALKLALSTTSSSSFPLGPHRSDAADVAPLSSAGTGMQATAAPTAVHSSAASFSAFEKRRIAHLLGRVALEIAAVWMYIQQGEPFCGSSPADPIAPAASVSTTTSGSAWQSSNRSATVLPSSSSTPASASVNGGNERGNADVDAPGAERNAGISSRLSHSVWRGAANVRQDVCDGGLAAHITTLSTLFGSDIAVRLLGDKECCRSEGQNVWVNEDVGSTAPPSVGTTTLHEADDTTSSELICPSLGNTNVAVEKMVDVASRAQSCCPSAQVDVSPVVAEASQVRPPALTGVQLTASEVTVPYRGEVAVTPPEEGPVQKVGRSVRCNASQSKRDVALASSIPSYLRAYVVVDGSDDNSNESVHLGESNINWGRNDHPMTGASFEQCQFSFASADSAEARPVPRATEHPVTSHDESSHTRLSSGFFATENAARVGLSCTVATGTRPSVPVSGPASFVAPTCGGGSGGTTTTVAPLLETASVSDSSSLRAQRVFSASSLRTTSLMSSPVQPPQLCAQPSQGPSGLSASTQPTASVAQQSLDSVEMSPAATAAYLRSTNLFRRPHRFEVPVSRTQSLRRVPSISSSVSLAGASVGSAPGVAHHSGMLNVATGAHGNSSVASSHVAKSSSAMRLSSGVGVLRTPSYFFGIPPVAAGASTNADSPQSSVAELHFKRVISLDSEAGVWPQGSFADSLEMSQQKVAPPVRRPSAFASEGGTISSPLQREASLAVATRSHGDNNSAPNAPAEGHSEGDFPVARSFSSHWSPTQRPGRAEHTHNRSTKRYHSAPNTTFSSPLTEAVPAATICGSSSWQPPPALLSPVQCTSFHPRGTVGTVALPTALSPAPVTSAGCVTPAASPLISYRIEEETLTAYLRCLHDLTQADLTDAEFDSLQLRYFLPGVSLVTATATTEKPPLSSPPRAPPLPLFEGGELVPLHRSSLDVYCCLVRKRLVEVCHHLRIWATPYLSLL